MDDDEEQHFSSESPNTPGTFQTLIDTPVSPTKSVSKRAERRQRIATSKEVLHEQGSAISKPFENNLEESDHKVSSKKKKRKTKMTNDLIDSNDIISSSMDLTQIAQNNRTTIRMDNNPQVIFTADKNKFVKVNKIQPENYRSTQFLKTEDQNYHIDNDVDNKIISLVMVPFNYF
jgi:hypothetical protein